MEVLYNATLYRNEAGEVCGIFASAHDITQRNQVEEALKASEEKYRTLVENAPVGISITRENRSVERNRALMQMHGYNSIEEFNRVPIIDLYADKEDRKRFLAQLEKGLVHNFEVKHKRKDGSIFWVSMTAVSQTGKSGEKQILGITQDITARKQAEEALKISEKKYRKMIEDLPVGITLNTVDGLRSERNKAYMEMHGYTSKEEFERIPAVELYFNPEDRRRFLNKLEEGTLRNFEIRHKRKDGSQFWVSLSAIPQIGVLGEKLSLVVAQDITERKVAEEALRSSEEKFRNLVENAPVGIAIVSKDGRSILRNQAMAEMVGYELAEIIDIPAIERYYDPEDRGRFLELAEKGAVRNFETRLKCKRGGYLWVTTTSIHQKTEISHLIRIGS
jgi:PAS domain S-box-containing protein